MKFILFSKVAALRQNTREPSVVEKKAMIFLLIWSMFFVVYSCRGWHHVRSQDF